MKVKRFTHAQRASKSAFVWIIANDFQKLLPTAMSALCPANWH